MYNDNILDSKISNPQFDMRPNGERATWVILALRVILGLMITNIILDIVQFFILLGDDPSLRALKRIATYEEYLLLVYLIALLCAGISFISWFRRAYFNLHTIYENLSYSEGWAAGSWFVPIISLYYPYQIMKELYELTAGFLSGKEKIDSSLLSTSKVGWWWAMWIISSFTSPLIPDLAIITNSFTEAMFFSVILLGGHFLQVISCILAIKVVISYAKAEEILYQVITDEWRNNPSTEENEFLTTE